MPIESPGPTARRPRRFRTKIGAVLLLGLPLTGCAGTASRVDGRAPAVVRGQSPPEVPDAAEAVAPGLGTLARPTSNTPNPDLARDEEEAPRFPDLDSDPLEGSRVPPARRDRLLFPRLSNLFVENLWDLNDDPVDARKDRLDERATVDIRAPGPDTANFPNSPFTIPKGRVYLETSPLGLYGPQLGVPPQYNWEFLFRYGITDNLEFRIFSNGYTATGRPEFTSGFSPLAWDLKVHLWEANPKYLIPATGLEVYVATDMGSPAFNGGTQPSLNLLLEQELPLEIQLEYSFSLSGTRLDGNLSDYVFGFQWSFQRELFRDFAVFTHGFYNSAALPRLRRNVFDLVGATDAPEVVVVGGGAVWTLNDHLAVFGSYNAGLMRSAPTTIALLGFAVGF